MRQKRRWIAMTMAAVMGAGLCTGCVTKAELETTAAPAATEAPAQSQAPAEGESVQETTKAPEASASSWAEENGLNKTETVEELY